MRRVLNKDAAIADALPKNQADGDENMFLFQANIPENVYVAIGTGSRYTNFRHTEGGPIQTKGETVLVPVLKLTREEAEKYSNAKEMVHLYALNTGGITEKQADNAWRVINDIEHRTPDGMLQFFAKKWTPVNNNARNNTDRELRNAVGQVGFVKYTMATPNELIPVPTQIATRPTMGGGEFLSNGDYVVLPEKIKVDLPCYNMEGARIRSPFKVDANRTVFVGMNNEQIAGPNITPTNTKILTPENVQNLDISHKIIIQVKPNSYVIKNVPVNMEITPELIRRLAAEPTPARQAR